MLLTNETKLLHLCLICHLILLDFHFAKNQFKFTLQKILNNFQEYYTFIILTVLYSLHTLTYTYTFHQIYSVYCILFCLDYSA